MVWLNPNGYKGQTYVELRLNAPKSEKIFLEFNPLKISDTPNWNPMWEEWHCYSSPLRIYKQDYEQLIEYFNKVYPVRDAFSGTLEQAFDACFDNWIGERDRISDEERTFFMGFLNWLKEALKYSSIIVVEGNL